MIPLSDFIKATFGRLPGGLAVAGIIFAAFLGSISGSAAACLAIIGTVMVPVFVENGYDRPFASGLAVTSAELGLLIPPSLFFIIFGALNRISIVDLFMGGVGMGLLTAFLMCVVAVMICKKRNYATMSKASWKEKQLGFIKILPLILMPVLVLGGIYGGYFSPTQAASVACLYSLLIGFFIYKELTWGKIMEATIDTVKISSMIYFLIIGADLMGRMFAYIELPQIITEYVISLELGPLGFMMMVNLVLLVMGFFFSSLPMVIIVLPLFIPSVISLGIDPVFTAFLLLQIPSSVKSRRRWVLSCGSQLRSAGRKWGLLQEKPGRFLGPGLSQCSLPQYFRISSCFWSNFSGNRIDESTNLWAGASKS